MTELVVVPQPSEPNDDNDLNNLKHEFILYSNVPERYLGIKFQQIFPRTDSKSQREALAFMKRWASGDKVVESLASGGSIVLSGNIGCGKTSIVIAAAKTFAYNVRCLTNNNTFLPYFISASDAVNVLFQHDEKQRRMLHKRPLLILDDLGRQWIKDYSAFLLDDLLHARHDNNVITIITTNILLKDLPAMVGEHIWDRMCESWTTLEIQAKSWRRLSLAERHQLSTGR